jgi:hypothetical protein
MFELGNAERELDAEQRQYRGKRISQDDVWYARRGRGEVSPKNVFGS